MHAADAVPIVEVVIELGDEIVHVDVVVKSIADVDALCVVQGESRAVAGHASARHRTACNVQAGLTDRDSAGLKIGNRIGNAVGAIASAEKGTSSICGHR